MTFQGVILAAGRGRRMGAISNRCPKALLPVLGKPLLQIQIEKMIGIGITEIVIVVGHLGDKIIKFVQEAGLPADITFVEQREFLGLAHALACVEGAVDRPFLLMLADIYFHSQKLKKALNEFSAFNLDGMILTKIETKGTEISKNFAVIEGQSRWVRKVLEKPIDPPSSIKGTGVYVFSSKIFDAIRQTSRSSLRNEYELTDAIQVLVNKGGAVRHSPLVTDDMNLTRPGDLLVCNLKALRRLGLPQAEISKYPMGDICG